MQPTAKRCAGCGETKARDEFYASKNRRDGMHGYCKPCADARSHAWKVANVERVREYGRDWRRLNLDRRRASERLTKYGVSPDEFESMLRAQDGRCAICVDEFPATPHVDHCHETGKIRGLLCNNCNTGLGRFRDNPMLLQAATIYLAESLV